MILACGSKAAQTLGGCEDGYHLAEKLGGDLEIFWDQQKNTVFMTGPAEVVFDGEIKL